MKQKNTLLFFLVVLHLDFASAQALKKYRILTYGLPNFEMENSKAVVAERWNIEFYPVAGCVVDSDLEDSVAKENAIVKKRLATKFGTNWRDKFDKEVDEEFKLQSRITQLLNKQSFIKKKQIEIEKLGGDLSFEMQLEKKNSVYIVKVSGYEKLNGEYKYFSYYKLEVNYKTKLVRIIDSQKLKD